MFSCEEVFSRRAGWWDEADTFGARMDARGIRHLAHPVRGEVRAAIDNSYFAFCSVDWI